MSLGQLVYYHNEALAQKYPSKKSSGGLPSYAEMPHDVLIKKREELRNLYGKIGD